MPDLPGVRTMPAVGIAHWRHWHLGWHHRGGAAQAQAARIKKFKQHGAFKPSSLSTLRMSSLFTVLRPVRPAQLQLAGIRRVRLAGGINGRWPR